MHDSNSQAASNYTIKALLTTQAGWWVIPLGGAIALLSGVSGGVSLLGGVVLGVLLGNPWIATTRKLTKRLLAAAVVGLGAGMNLVEVARMGASGFVYTFVSIGASLLVGVWLARWLRVQRNTGLLITVGTAICGGSAIAAAAPVLAADDEQMTVSLATVFLLNGLALFIFPPIGHAFGLGQADFGLWAALAIHDTSSVVGASMTYGQEALKIGTTIKLTRALWIVPVTVGLGMYVARSRDTESQPPASAGAAAKPSRPWFILGFLLVAAMVTVFPALRPAGQVVSQVAEKAMVLILFLIGAGLTRETLTGLSPRPLVQGVVLWVIVASASLLFIAAPWA
ncbi:YeiH family protein [Bradymonas sediminis]|uniref:Putative sulfate exporter family transporter n=1 Tax=Bradymonas sediminis TaxID=1548548 RepID=A0A2Z4FR10_9DELT|nr:putative sulfate exporter family transporter [Bradymonas sediminis]AWV91390.1 putative sulfate exporter family transporter [Bradymonas sediminis]TDP73612.1 putative integral membrane protein (TIGR00698 family) [Bradymonas sediminis]